MPDKSFGFGSKNGDRKYSFNEFSRFFNDFFSDGIFSDKSTNFQVIAEDETMLIKRFAGSGFLQGKTFWDDYVKSIKVDVADGVLNRIDRVVVRCDYRTDKRTIETVVKKGIFAANPVAPVLQRDADIYELGLADIYIKAGAIKITQADITDLRLNTEYCGIVKPLEKVDTTTIFNQYLDWYKRFTKNSEDEFWKWFSNLKLNIDKYIESEINDFHEWCQKTQNIYEIFQDTETQKFLAWCEKTRNDYDFFKDTQTQNFLKWFENLKNMLEDNQASNLQAQIDDIRTVRWGKSLYTWGWLVANKVTWADLASGFPVEYEASRFDAEKLLTKAEASEVYSTKKELQATNNKFKDYATNEKVDNIFPVTWEKLAGKKEE